MSYWVGYFMYDPQADKEPLSKQLLGPFATRQEAKEAKYKNRELGVFQTDIFEADLEDEPMVLIQDNNGNPVLSRGDD